jgi:hypothetical protein
MPRTSFGKSGTFRPEVRYRCVSGSTSPGRGGGSATADDAAKQRYTANVANANALLVIVPPGAPVPLATSGKKRGNYR